MRHLGAAGAVGAVLADGIGQGRLDSSLLLGQRGIRRNSPGSHRGRPYPAVCLDQHVADLPPAPAGKVRLTGLAGLADFVAKADPELVGNAMICAINQAVYLLNRQLKSQSEAFVEEGGFTERLYAARSQRRAQQAQEAQDAAVTPAPACPRCGKSMVQRMARSGPQAGGAFWGCSAYPACKGTRAVEKASPAGQSDRSDESGAGKVP